MDKDIQKLILKIQEAAFEVRTHLDAGYLKKVYQNALFIELAKRGIKVQQEVSIPVFYKAQLVGEYRADLVVEDKVILELKAVDELSKIHSRQLVNYLKATGIDYGILINYGGAFFEFKSKTRFYEPHQS